MTLETLAGSRYFRAFVFGLLLICYGLTSAEEINLISGGVDLGRHLKNGELCLSPAGPKGTADQILHTNFYSYTCPGAPFINHHWLTDLLFFLVWKTTGFAGLNLFYIAAGALTFSIFFHVARIAAGFVPAVALALAYMPVLTVRASVRPEVFSYLMCSLFF